MFQQFPAQVLRCPVAALAGVGLQPADSRAAYLHSDDARSSVTPSRTSAISVVVARVVPTQVLFAGKGANLLTSIPTDC